MTNALLAHKDKFIKFPTAKEAKNSNLLFFDMAGMPKVFGAIDGTHIRLAAPYIDPMSYMSRKNHYSINVQVSLPFYLS